jgi:hypothetical protein
MVDQARGGIISARSAVESTIQTQRTRSRALDASIETYELDADVGGGILAGAVAFRVFLFMVPYVYVVCTLLGVSARLANEDPVHLAKTVAITGVLASGVVNSQNLSAWTQVFLTLGATMLLIITARTLAKALYTVHWLVWRALLQQQGANPNIAGNRSYTRSHFLHYAGVLDAGVYR